jgi:hypothetical protein
MSCSQIIEILMFQKLSDHHALDAISIAVFERCQVFAVTGTIDFV